MCIRDSGCLAAPDGRRVRAGEATKRRGAGGRADRPRLTRCCLLYTSDAADERSSVDLGGRRIIKKKKDESRG